HTPYDIPKTYNPYPIELTDEMKSKLKTSSDVALKNLTAFQYANDCLGQFIEKLKKSPSGKNTIVVITGDHNILQTFEFSDKDLLMKYSVPLIIYIPDAYKPKNTANTNIFASHKDIFPTIFNISLSNSKYLKTGNNLFASDLKNSYGLYCYKVAMDSIGCVDFTTNTPLFFRWNETRNQLEPSKENPDKYLQDLMLKSKAYVASMNLFIMNDLANKTKNEVEKK
ncbi:MAG TPA: sulfatase-like hydrolase/transferase, partial [Tenuifilaceae bacterium]|nr:sulfatase-like hydrolase/transferase [Tenuifilaceae bacterium]